MRRGDGLGRSASVGGQLKRALAAVIAAVVILPPAIAFDFPAAVILTEDNADSADPAAYAARTVREGVRIYWDGEAAFHGEGDELYRPPAWFIDGFPAEAMDGIFIDRSGDVDAIRRIIRNTAAEDGWRRLSFIVFDLPEASGGFTARRERLQNLIREANLPNLRAEQWQVFADNATLRRALDEMYRSGGDGYLLRYAESDYDADAGELLLALPYQVGEADIVRHRPGQGEYIGMMGSMEVITDDGVEFVIGSGFSRDERREPPPVGGRVTYKYKDYTTTGKPKNPVFLRTVRKTAAVKKLGGILETQTLMWIFIALMTILAALDAITHKRGGRRWNFKSAIVSTGLLGTFIGIWWGLYHFDTSDIAGGVPTLLEGLKLSFVTSIIGIALSTILSIVQTITGVRD